MSFPINFNNLTFITPSPKDALDEKFSDIKKLAESKWAQANQTYIQLKNQHTNQVPVNMEQLRIVLKNISDNVLQYIDTTIDRVIYSKTGYHLSEFEDMLSFGNQIWSVMQTMYQTGQTPQPEWIVDTANTIKKMDKTNNVYIDEAVSHINKYWNKYRQIEKQYSGVLDILSRSNNKTFSPEDASGNIKDASGNIKGVSGNINVYIDSSIKNKLQQSLDNDKLWVTESLTSQYNSVKDSATGLYNSVESIYSDVSTQIDGFKNHAMDIYDRTASNITDDISTWKNKGTKYYNSLTTSYNTIKQEIEDASAYYNMFKDPKELKKTLNNLLQGWLSSKNEILCNVFMVNKFKTIIKNIQKTADEGFKKGEDMFVKIEASISMFKDIKDLLYAVKKIPIADSYADMIDIDTSGITSKWDAIKNNIDTVKTSIQNSVKSLENLIPAYKNYITGLSNNLTGILQGAKANILDIRDYFEDFAFDKLDILESIEKTIISDIQKSLNVSLEDIVSKIDLNQIRNNIEIGFKSELLDKLISGNHNLASDITSVLSSYIKPSSDPSANIKQQDPSANIKQQDLSSNKSFKLDVSVNISEILNNVIQKEIQTNIENILNTTKYITNNVNNTLNDANTVINKSANKVYATAGSLIDKAGNTVSSMEGLINDSLTTVSNTANNITTALSAGISNFISIGESVMSLDDLMPDIKIQAPPFIKYFINMLDALNPVMNLLNHLVSNYRTNKRMTREAALLKLSKMNTLQKLKQGFNVMISNIKNAVNVTDKRTADFIRDEILINDEYIAERFKNDYGVKLTKEGIKKYNEQAAEKLPEDYDGAIIINDEGKLKIDENTHTDELFIKDTTEELPVSSSYIMEKMSENSPCDEEFPPIEGDGDEEITRDMVYPELQDEFDTGVNDEINIDELNLSDPEQYELYKELKKSQEEYLEELKLKEIKKLRDTLKFETDEFEGLQNLITDNINLCENPVSLYSNVFPKPGYPYVISDTAEDIQEKSVIIEFAQDTINGEGLDFTLMVEPGEQITENHNIARITKNGETRLIKSIFKKGIVRKNEEGDYVHVYNSDRNIIIDDPEYNIDTRVMDELQEIETGFNEENDLYDLITNFIIYSVYPEILLNCESIEETREKLSSPLSKLVAMYECGDEIYNKWIKHFKDTEENHYENILGKKKITKKEAKSEIGNKLVKQVIEAKGNTEKIQEIAVEQINKRQEYISGKHYWESAKSGIIDLWENYTQNNNFYYKCRVLNDGFKDIREYLDLTYYIELYSDIDVQNNIGTWWKRYRELLLEILNYRRASQGDTYNKLITLLNTKAFDSDDYKLINIKDNDLWNYLEDNFKSEVPEYEVFKAFLSDKLNDPDDTPESFINKLYNIYEYIKHNDPSIISQLDPLPEDSNIEDLLKKENNKLKEFWTNAVSRYREIEFPKQQEKLQADEWPEIPWPEKINITLNRKDYDLYLFKDTFSSSDINLPDEVMEAEFEDYIDNLDNFTADVSSAAEDFNEVEFEQKKTSIDYTDIRYWSRWCSMATLANCVMGPKAWATGMIVSGMFVQFPCILIPIKVINIKFVKMTIVIGLAIRLIDIKPMVIYVNQYNEVNNINVAVTGILEKVKEEYNKYMSYLENINLNAVQLLINKLERNNDNLLKENRQLEIVLQDLKAFLPNDWADAKREIMSIVGETELFQNVYRIKNYPKGSDFDTTLNLKFGQAGSIFNEQDFTVDLAKMSVTDNLKNELAELTDPSVAKPEEQITTEGSENKQPENNK